jgi:hypothetical protein
MGWLSSIFAFWISASLKRSFKLVSPAAVVGEVDGDGVGVGVGVGVVVGVGVGVVLE